MIGLRQRYGMLLLALAILFVFEGVAHPGDAQRVIGTVLAGGTLMIALYAADVPHRRLRIAGTIVALLVAGVIAALLANN